MRISEKSLKKDAKKLKKEYNISSLSTALDLVARQNGYQSWKHAKPILSKLRNDTRFARILESEVLSVLVNAYKTYIDDGKYDEGFLILCRLSELTEEQHKNEIESANFRKQLANITPDYERLNNLSVARLYICTNLAWHQVHGLGCEKDYEAAKHLFLLSAEFGSYVNVGYGHYALGRFYEIQEKYEDAERVYLYVINTFLQNAGSYYQLAKLRLEGCVKGADVGEGEYFLNKAKRKRHPEGKRAFERFHQLFSLRPSPRTIDEFFKLVKEGNIFVDFESDCYPDVDILLKISL